jgi:hypothetical protein
MSFSINYSGRLSHASMLPQLVDEVEDICKVLGWKSNVFNTEYPSGEYISPLEKGDFGIVFTPTDCEPISLVFDSEGRIYSPWLKKMFDGDSPPKIKVITVRLDLNDENPEPVISEGDSESFNVEEMIYQISTKTEFSNASDHIKLLELIRYLSEKYLAEFTLHDESEYWETRNPEKLEAKMTNVIDIIDKFHTMIENTPFSDHKDFIAFIKKLSQQLRDNKDDL